MTYVTGSATGGATYDAATRQIRFNGPVTPGIPIAITYRATVDADVPPGSVLANDAVVSYIVNNTTYHMQRTAAVAVPNATLPDAVLIYANGDNNLSTRMIELLNRAEKSAANPNSVVLILLDGPADDDARLYRVKGDLTSCPSYPNPTCDGRYVLGQNLGSGATIPPTPTA